MVRVGVGVCYCDSRWGEKQEAMTKARHCCRVGGGLQTTYQLGRGDNAIRAGRQQQRNKRGGGRTINESGQIPSCRRAECAGADACACAGADACARAGTHALVVVLSRPWPSPSSLSTSTVALECACAGACAGACACAAGAGAGALALALVLVLVLALVLGLALTIPLVLALTAVVLSVGA